MTKTVVRIFTSVLYTHRPHVTHTHTHTHTGHVSPLADTLHAESLTASPVISLIRTIFPVIHLKSPDYISGESRILFQSMLSIFSRKYSKEQNCINS